MLDRSVGFRCLILSLVLVSPAVLWAADTEGREPGAALARLDLQPARVDWQPKAGDQRLVLTVSGPGGFYLQRELGPGQAPFLSALDLADGTYAYELRAVAQLDAPAEDGLVQSGHLWVQDGSFKAPLPPRVSPPEKSQPILPGNLAQRDTVLADDHVVQGQACIGTNCVNGDADLGPTLLFKEDFGNLLQIKFDNIGCCHPSTRDWALQANDTANATGDFLIRDLTAGTVPFRVGSQAPDNALTIYPVFGHIGIGTLTPAVRLDVKGSTAGAAIGRVQNSSATGFSGFEYLNQAGTVSAYLGTDNANAVTRFNSVNNYPLVVLTNNTERMRVTSAGSVGVGTAAPSSRLHVNGGDVRVSGGSFIDDGVTLNVPDYVFEPDYRLMPLDELKRFVAREKHLPNVPRALDVKEQGLNLSQFQMRLLEKVEELTLYTLGQHEQLAAQRQELVSLSEQNAQLQRRLAELEETLSTPEPH